MRDDNEGSYQALLAVTNVLNSQRDSDSLWQAITEQIRKVLPGERAGGPFRMQEDYVWSNQRLPYSQSGQWGYLRVLPGGDQRIKPLGAIRPATAEFPVQRNPALRFAEVGDRSLLERLNKGKPDHPGFPLCLSGSNGIFPGWHGKIWKCRYLIDATIFL